MTKNILDTMDLSQLGQRLQQARKKQGLTQADSAKIIGVARTTIIAIEKGERQIKASELLKLSEAYGLQVSDFVHSKPQVSLAEVQFRSTSSILPEDEAKIVEAIDSLVELCTNYLELEQLTKEPLAQNYPPIYRSTGLRTEQAAEGLAIAERNRLGLGEGPIPILRELLEEEVGLRIFYLPVKPSSKIMEIYFFEPHLGGCIAINRLQEKSRERCRWSLAHAYAHFLAHRRKTAVSLENQYQRKPENERFADYFANFFLMPTSGLTQRFNMMYQTQGQITPADLVKLAHYYGVSFQALILRLEDMRLIPSGVWEKLKERGFEVNEAKKRLGLEPIPEATDKFPTRYVSLAMAAYHAGEISEGELGFYLQTDRFEARISALEWQSKVDETISQDILELVSS